MDGDTQQTTGHKGRGKATITRKKTTRKNTRVTTSKYKRPARKTTNSSDTQDTFTAADHTHDVLRPTPPLQREKTKDFLMSVPGWAIILVSLGVVYLLINLALPRLFSGFTTAYIIGPLLWCLVITVTLLISRYWAGEKLQFTKSLLWIGLLLGTFQVSAFVITGLFFGFGRSPYSFTPTGIILNLTYVGSALVGMELSRAYLIKTFSKTYETIALVVIAILFTTISISLVRLTGIESSPSTNPFFGSTVIPLLAQNFLACILALTGGPVAAIAYVGVLEAFKWFCPIMPDPPWIITAVVGTITVIIGMIVVQSIAKAEHIEEPKQTKQGLLPRLEWVGVAIISAAMIWASFGLSGFHPTLVAGRSMEPAIDLGDIVIVNEISTNTIHEGDIIQFKDDHDTIIHRVLEVRPDKGSRIFITKGDSNKTPDSRPVYPDQIMGKVTYTIPKIGWASIGIKNMLH